METKGTQALDRGLALFAAVVRDDGVTPAATLAAAIGLPPSSARRMVAALERQGLIGRIARGRYAGTDRLASLAARIDPHRRLIEAARPLLARLAAAEHATAHLGIFEGDMVTYLVKEGVTGVFTRERGQLEAYCTGIGKVLLAQLPHERLETYLRGSFVQLTERTITLPDRLRAEVDGVRQRGYAIDNGEMADDVSCVAVPVRVPGAELVAISISAHSACVTPPTVERTARLLQSYAAAITRRLPI